MRGNWDFEHKACWSYYLFTFLISSQLCCVKADIHDTKEAQMILLLQCLYQKTHNRYSDKPEWRASVLRRSRILFCGFLHVCLNMETVHVFVSLSLCFIVSQCAYSCLQSHPYVYEMRPGIHRPAVSLHYIIIKAQKLSTAAPLASFAWWFCFTVTDKVLWGFSGVFSLCGVEGHLFMVGHKVCFQQNWCIRRVIHIWKTKISLSDRGPLPLSSRCSSLYVH